MAAKDTKAKNKEAEALPEGQAEKPKKKSRLKRIVIVLVILLMMLGGAGGGAYWWFFMRTPGSTFFGEEKDPEEGGMPPDQAGGENAPAGQASFPDSGKPSAEGGGGVARIERQSDLPRSAGIVLPLPPVTVNLSDSGGKRYLKLSMEVEANADISEALKTLSPRIRDAIIMLLAGKAYTDISTPDGKVLLKAEVASRLNQILGAQRIIRVYFTDFVVQ